MTSVTHLLEEVRAKGYEEAYWRALGKALGSSSPILRATLRARFAAPGEAEWESVARGLEQLLGPRARAVEAMARREAPVGEPRPLDAAAPGLREHWMHLFDGPGEAERATAEFVLRGLRRGARVVVWGPAAALEALAPKITAGMAGTAGAWLPIAADGDLRALGAAPGTAAAERAVEGVVASVAGAPEELWVCGHVAGLLLAEGIPRAAAAVEEAWHRRAARTPLTVYCPYALAGPADVAALLALARPHHWVAAGGLAYPVASARR